MGCAESQTQEKDGKEGSEEGEKEMSSNDQILILLTPGMNDTTEYFVGYNSAIWDTTNMNPEALEEFRKHAVGYVDLDSAHAAAEELDKQMRTEYGIRVMRLPHRKSYNLLTHQVEWVIDDEGDLGVKIGDQFFFLYKGNSLLKNEFRWRKVQKRADFGECCRPAVIDPGGIEWQRYPAA